MSAPRRLDHSPPPATAAPRGLAVLGLLIVGVGLVLYAGGWQPSQAPRLWQYDAALVAALLALIPPVNRLIRWVLTKLRHPSPRGVRAIAVALTLLAANYFIFTGIRQGRELIPKYHDEHVYLIQAQMLAHGRLWMPALPLPQFFETFYLLVKPVYAGVYVPGTALLYAPSVWLNVPPWAWATFICGAVVGMTYRVLSEFVDGVWALIGALLLLGLAQIHFLSLMVMSHSVSLLLGLGMTWAWLRWRRSQRIAWVIVVGLFAGWAAITRPLDAVCFALPIGIAMLLEIRSRGARAPIATIVAGCLAAAPFLALQLVFNRAVTGHATQTAVTYYDRLYAPEWQMGRPHRDPNFRPPSSLPQMQKFYREFVVHSVSDVIQHGVVRVWLTRRLPESLRTWVPAPVVLVLLPIGLLGVMARRRWVMALAIPLFIGLYVLYPPFLTHYALLAAPAALLLVVTGAGYVTETFGRRQGKAEAVLAAALLGLVLTSLSELNPWLRDPNMDAPVLADVERKLSEISRPSVVLFHFDPANDPNEEPVYNVDVPWPDDARVIRAHDLGVQNVLLYRYYAARSPHRMIYLYDENNGELRELGMADALARTASVPGG